MQHDVFISYTQPDRNMALRIHELFQAQGLTSWIAVSKSNGIAVGQGFEGEIVAAALHLSGRSVATSMLPAVSLPRRIARLVDA